MNFDHNYPVVNELLCFVANNMGAMTFDQLHKVCMEFFTIEDIKAAKEILANYIPNEDNNLHKRTRKGEIIMSDILSFMVPSSPASLPVFVVADLSMTPLVPVDRINAMALFREIQKLRAEMHVMKADLANF